MNKKEKQQIKYLLENLKWYSEAPDEQDYNGEYEPPMEWEQGEAKIFLKYLEEKDKEIERLKSRLEEYQEYVEINHKEIERLNSIINNDFSKICREKMIDKLSANEMILLQDKEIERLNNIINKAKEKSIFLQKRYGYVLDDLTYLLMQGSDK